MRCLAKLITSRCAQQVNCRVATIILSTICAFVTNWEPGSVSDGSWVSAQPLPLGTPYPGPPMPPYMFWLKAHALRVRRVENNYYGARARIWVGNPLLRWPTFSYGAIWIAGDQSVTSLSPISTPAGGFPTATGMAISQRAEVGIHLAPSRSSGDSARTVAAIVQAGTPTPTPLPTLSPGQSITWIESGFHRADYLSSPSGTSCEYIATWATGANGGGLPQYAAHVSGGVRHEVEIYLSVTKPSAPFNPNPSTPLWSIEIREIGNDGSRALIFEKRDVNPLMMIGDEIHMGGEVETRWPSAVPTPLDRLNDMGVHAYSRAQWLHKVPATDTYNWHPWKMHHERVSYRDWGNGTMIDLRPPAALRYRALVNPHVKDPDGQPVFQVQGFNNASTQNTWMPCDCAFNSGGRVPCRSPGSEPSDPPSNFP